MEPRNFVWILGKFFVAIGRAELSKMVSCPMDNEAFVIKTLHCSGDYCVDVCCVSIRMELCLIGEPCDIQDNRIVFL
jgi:hypothetical protein